MAVRLSPILLVITAVAVAGLTACEKKEVATTEAPALAATASPDPAAPAPGTQAAEAIGADSSSDEVVIPPEKQRH